MWELFSWKRRSSVCMVLLCWFIHGVSSHDASSLKALSATSSSITVQWTEEEADAEEHPHKFKILAKPLEKQHHSSSFTSGTREWFFDYHTNRAELVSLSPATKYNITIWTVHESNLSHPLSGTFWTHIAEPNKPAPVSLLSHENDQISIKINEAFNQNGPISAYQIVVVISPDITIFNPEVVYDYETADKKGIPFYVAAQLSPSQVKDDKHFTVGDGQQYGGYLNAKLDPEEHYAVVTGIVSTFNGITKVSYSDFASFHDGILDKDIEEPAESSANNGWVASVAVFAVLLVVSVILYVLLRRYYKPNFRRPSQQQLAVSNPAFDGMNGDAATNGIYLDDVSVQVTHEMKEPPKAILDIPFENLHIRKSIIGHGKFGKVQWATVQCQLGKQVQAIVVTTQAPSMMTAEEQRNIKNEINTLHRVSFHQNVVALIGTTENHGCLHIAIEHSPQNLLSVLHKSRSTDSSRSGIITSFTCHQLLLLALNVAQGLQHLHQYRIVHQHLMAYNVLMMENVPKLYMFGLSYFEHDQKNKSTRWQAAETLQSNRHTYKSDIWSLAVVIWEILTLGGTPYYSISDKEVVRKVMQGTRLPQPSNVSFDLFQLLLDCWQTDVDERPTIQSVINTLDLIAKDNRDHLNVRSYSGFEYHQFDATQFHA